MAQSATKESALLWIEPLSDRPTLEPPLRLVRRKIILKLAKLAREGSHSTYYKKHPLTKSPFLPCQFKKYIWTTVRPRVREIVEFETTNPKLHGLRTFGKSKQWEFYAAIDREKLSQLHTLVRHRCLTDFWFSRNNS